MKPTKNPFPGYAAALATAAAAAAIMPSAARAEEPAADSIDEVVVIGVRGAERKAVELKRSADSIQDSISAEDIGKLPDATISDSLQRITGVQIDREAGEGTSVNIRGLPQVGTLLNGEAFLTTAAITSSQPNFGDIPSQLFSGADVTKSATASLLNGGITGTINLRTRRPLDLQKGWTASAAAQGTRGSGTGKKNPEFDGLLAFHAERWGLLASASYSDVTLEDSQDGMDQYGGMIHGEDTISTTASDGFLNAWLGAPLPGGLTLLHPADCVNSGGTYGTDAGVTPQGCDVDVNGDGKASAGYYNTPDFSALDQQLEHKRLGFNLSAQGELANGLTVTGDVFYTDDRSNLRTNGYQLNSATWEGATFLPLVARNTGAQVYSGFNQDSGGQQLLDFYTTQRYQFYLGDIETFSNNAAQDSKAQNYNLELKYDRGGPFSGEVRALYGKASEVHMESYLQFAVSDGALWPNEPVDAAPPGTMVFPGGNRVFDPFGIAANTVPAVIDMTGRHMGVSLPADLQATLANPNAWSLKTVASENNHDRSATMQVLRADGHWKFDGNDMRLDFGLRQGNRSAGNTNFALIAPVYGAYAYHNVVDPLTGDETATTVADPTGCYVHYKAADVILDGGGVPGGCKAGDAVTGFYRANPYAALSPGQLPAIVANNVRLYSRLAGVNGVSIYNLDPKIMDNVLAFQDALYPGEVRDIDPGGTYHVQVKQTTGYLQGNFKGEWLWPFNGNVGFRYIKTDLAIDQHKSGVTGPYYVSPVDLGATRLDRNFNDFLPALNLAVELRDNLKLRLAFSKNMQLLDLDQWGGGLTLDYAIVAGTSPPIIAVQGGNQAGNPDLKPWRSNNYDLSLEYYIGRASLLSVALFKVDVTTYVVNGSVLRTDLPDQDGVVRNRTVAINLPLPGSGNGASLKGMEIGYKQAFDFLPGRLSNLGIDANFTYSPSDTGKDIAGNSIPFQDNSREQANLVLWYQSSRFQARIAGNYRSKRAVGENYAGITGFEKYQAPTHYYDASASYDVSRRWQVYVNGSNITKERERYYLVWPDQVLGTKQYEARYTLGVRGRF
jgi:TonB-dependent receptor